jgi:hypothetical protein
MSETQISQESLSEMDKYSWSSVAIPQRNCGAKTIKREWATDA